ncbi:hypothetical protein Tco_0515184, partial [Tanacetum coccineum]
MLNKDNYVPWSSRLLRYAKSKPNGKLIYNSIMHGPYVRRMIPEPGDLDREVPVAETFYEQTDKELTDKEQMMKVSEIGVQEKKDKLFNEWERFTSTDGGSIESYYHRFPKLMNDFKRNKHFLEKIASNLKFLNNYNQNGDDMLPLWLKIMNALQNPGVQNVGNQNGLIVVLRIANQNVNQNGNGNVVAARAEGDLDKIEEVNANCILMAKLQQASTSGTETDKAPVYDSDGLAKEAQQKQQSLYNGKVLLEKHDPPAVYDPEETLQLAQERIFVSQKDNSREESCYSNTSKMDSVSKSISILNEEFLDDTTPSVARKFLNE